MKERRKFACDCVHVMNKRNKIPSNARMGLKRTRDRCEILHMQITFFFVFVRLAVLLRGVLQSSDRKHITFSCLDYFFACNRKILLKREDTSETKPKKISILHFSSFFSFFKMKEN